MMQFGKAVPAGEAYLLEVENKNGIYSFKLHGPDERKCHDIEIRLRDALDSRS